MKKFIFSVAAALMIFAIGCNKTDGDPKTVLMSFYDAMAKKDVEGAKKFATKESAQMLDMMKMGMNASTDKKDTEDFNKDNVEFGDAKIEGDKATVPVKNKAKGESVNMILKKEDGKWKVAFDKASMMEMAGQNGGLNGAGAGTDSTLQNMPATGDSLQNNMGNDATTPATTDSTSH